MKTRTRKQSPFAQVSILGVGVIGGSLGMAIKKRFRSVRVVGFDRPEVLKRAFRRGAIDVAARNLQSAVKQSELVILAMPVSEILRVLPRVARSVGARTIVTDVGSVKQAIVRQAERVFPGGNFIGGHPMAGVEHSGVDAAHPLMFENAIYVLTPTPSTASSRRERLGLFLEELGARIVLLDARIHDEVASVVSHLPQLTAVALTNVVGKRHAAGRRHLRLAAGGFRDLTRIASSKPAIWEDILTLNKTEIDRALRLLIRELKAYQGALRRSRGFALATEFNEARSIRNSIPKSMKGFIRPLAELYVFVQDRPGMVARLATSLAKVKINIKDIELMKIREGRGGTFRLAFESRDVAMRAARVLRRAGFEIGD